MKMIIGILAYILIWTAIDLNRSDSCKIKLFDKNWWIAFGLIAVSGIVLSNINDWFKE